MLKGFSLILAFLLFTVKNSLADYWPDESCKKYFSVDGSKSVLIVPACYTLKKAKAKIADGCMQCNEVRPCMAYVYDSLSGNIPVYQFQLINHIAPADVFIRNDGRYMITIDNWGSRGWGDDVMVIYKNGVLLKKYRLEDISPIQVYNYFNSISSRFWFYSLEFSGKEMMKLIFRDKEGKKYEKYFDLEVIDRQTDASK